MKLSKECLGLLDKVVAEEAASHKLWEETTREGKFLVSELRAAFEKVADKGNWKNPVKAVIATKNAEITEAAIIFFTGSVPVFLPHRKSKTTCIVSAFGYYVAIGS